ncbi:sporozoite surface protein 2-like [Pectinophora gossypiella]|uniref:sporozoite surface protein 2-like n=1 Tax=Pectinophora gossypiella TaxID=13191 RepID=UPI00214E8A9E|nr:sporozoite surface protein 2-like [Pectinophora gossypiella]
MEKCITTVVVVTLLSHLTAGRSYAGVRLDKHSEFHHPFEHHEHRGDWMDKPHGWDSRQHHPSPAQYNPTHYNPHKRGDKEYWRLNHPGDYEPDSQGEQTDSLPRGWPNHGSHSSWSDQKPWPNHEKPNWSNQEPDFWSNNGWNNQDRPNSWTDQGRPGWYDPSGHNTEWYDQQRPNSNSWEDTGSPNTWGPVTPSTTANPNTKSPLAIANCIRSCPVTSEYNPVCGTNNVTYGNPGRLDCAAYCGVDVSLQRNSACTAVVATDSNTQGQKNNTRPSQPSLPSEPSTNPPEPTRFTTIDVPVTNKPSQPDPAFTIPPDVLNSIFTSTTEDDQYAIDIRTRSKFMPQYVYPIQT